MTVRQLWHRILAVALAALPLCAIVWIAAAWLYGAHTMLSAEITQTRQRLRDYESMLERYPEIKAAAALSSHNGHNYYWSGSTEEAASAELQQQLRGVIDAAGGNVHDVQTLPATRNGELSAVNLRVTLEASSTELLETLYSLESNRPYLFLSQLYVRGPERRARAPQAADAALQVTVDVRGYWEPQAE